MLKSNSLYSVLTGLETSAEDFITLLDRIIKISAIMCKRVEELSEEIRANGRIAQVFVEDIDFNFWLKATEEGDIQYEQGILDNADVIIWINRKIIIDILKGDISASDAYMRGSIKVKGNLTQAIQIRNFMLIFKKYLDTLQNK